MGVTLGSLELGSMPRVVAVLDRMLPVEQVVALEEDGVSILEVRVDLIGASLDELLEYLQKLRPECRLPLIGTIRETEQNRGNRPESFRRILPFVDCVDIEIDTPINKEVIEDAGEKTVIVSEHNFDTTPSIDELNALLAKSIDLGADITKIATMAHGADDVTRLCRFTDDNKDRNLVTIAMGEQGMVSRVIAPLFGSLFTYGCLDEPVAPGQLNVLHLLEELRRYFPRP